MRKMQRPIGTATRIGPAVASHATVRTLNTLQAGRLSQRRNRYRRNDPPPSGCRLSTRCCTRGAGVSCGAAAMTLRLSRSSASRRPPMAPALCGSNEYIIHDALCDRQGQPVGADHSEKSAPRNMACKCCFCCRCCFGPAKAHSGVMAAVQGRCHDA